MLVGRAKSERYTDGQVWGSAHTEARMAFDVSIVEPNSNSYSKRSGSSSHSSMRTLGQGMQREPRSGSTRSYALSDLGLTLSQSSSRPAGGMGEAFQRQIWHPHWKRVETAEDAEMGKSEWVSRRRKLMWMARFGVEIA
jgi:hypothetical protein